MQEGPPAPGVATPSEKVAQRVLRETGHFALWQLLGAGVGWGAHVALARLLSQRDFGVFGICSFYIGIGQLLGDGGLGATLLRRKGAVTDEEYRAFLKSYEEMLKRQQAAAKPGADDRVRGGQAGGSAGRPLSISGRT